MESRLATTADDVSDEQCPELDKYSPALSQISLPAYNDQKKLSSCRSRTEMLRRRIALTELELEKQKMELELAELGDNQLETSGFKDEIDHVSLNKLNPSQIQAGPSGSQGAEAKVPCQTTSRSSEEVLPELLNICMGLPKREIPKFSGDPLSYWNFIRAFTSGVVRYTSDATNRLSYLLHYCEGEAHELIEHCSMLSPDTGYNEALRILEEEFGDPRVISRQYITALTDGPGIKYNDAKGLSRLAVKMNACELTLSQLNYMGPLRDEKTMGSIVGRLPAHMQTQWYDLATSIQKARRDPKFSDLTEFIRDKAAAAKLQQRCMPETSRQTQRPTASVHDFEKKKVFSLATRTASGGDSGLQPRCTRSCPKCGQWHYLDSCTQFISLTQQERLSFVNQTDLCELCLKPNHEAKACRSRRNCGQDSCCSLHHPLLHEPCINNPTSESSPESNVNVNFQKELSQLDTTMVAMGLIPVTVIGPLGKRTVCGLLDSGSDATLIRKSLASELGLIGTPSTITISTVSGKASAATELVNFEIEPHFPVDDVIQAKAWTVKELPDAGSANISSNMLERWNHLKDIELPIFDRSRVDILLGMNVPVVHWVMDRRTAGSRDPYAIKTPLGWTILGPIGVNNGVNVCQVNINKVDIKEKRLYKQDFSDVPSSRLADYALDKVAVQEAQSTLKFPEGHYDIVPSWREGLPLLLTNYPLAVRRLLRLHKKLPKNPKLHCAYDAAVQVRPLYNYAESVAESCDDTSDCWCLPHHSVLHPRELKDLVNQDGNEGRRALKRRSSPLRDLAPFVAEGLMRVGGRLQWAALSFENKHPYVLPKDHFVTELVIKYHHERLGHVGPTQVLASVRQRFWILQGLAAVKRVLKKCCHCLRWFSKPREQIMAPLPMDRTVANVRPFTNVGVDYFGPVLVKRGRSTAKRYGCIFTCLATRAVHLEVAYTLDTDSFLCAFTRFVARRGNPVRLYSDNGTNFKGSEAVVRRCLREWDQDKIAESMLRHECDWVFSPPKASHYGGVWERLIRSIRRSLRSMLAEQLVDDEMLTTVLTEVEKVLNDRPLVKLTDDPEDYDVLTPNHILLLYRNPALDANLTEETSTRSFLVRRWRRMNHLVNVFWKRWSREYLTELQRRTKWRQSQQDLKEGDLVLLVDSNHRGMWSKGVVHTTRQSRDGAVREVVVKTKNGYVRRDVRQLCLLETQCCPIETAGEC